MKETYAIEEAMKKSMQNVKMYMLTNREKYSAAAMNDIASVIGINVGPMFEIRDMLIHDIAHKLKREMDIDMGSVANAYYLDYGDRDYIEEAANAIVDCHYAETDDEEDEASQRLADIMADANNGLMKSIVEYLPEYIIDRAVSKGIVAGEAKHLLKHAVN